MTHTSTARNHRRNRHSLRSAAKLGLGLLSLLSFSAGTVAHAGTLQWDGATADWFSNPSHWGGGAYPGAGDAAVNMSTAAMTLGQSTTIASFFSNGAFTLQGGTFSGSQDNAASTLQINSVFTDDGGAINNFTVNQGTGGSVVFTTNGGNSASGDIFNAGVNLSASNAYLRLFNTNTFNGAASLGASGGSGIHLYDGNANLVIGAKGSLSGLGGVVQDNGGATLTNNGLVNANSAGKTLNLALSNFNTTGTAEATNGGILTLSSTNTNAAAGSTLAATGAGSVVSIAGTFTGTGSNAITATNGGQVQVNGATLLGTINTDAATALIFDTNGDNTLNNTTVNGNLDLSTNGTAYVRMFNADTVNGSVSLGAGGNGIHLYDGNANFVVGAKGTLSSFGEVNQDNGGATLTNSGLVNAGGGTLNINVDHFANNGTVQVQNGAALNVNGGNTDSGNILVKKGGTATFTQGVTQTAGLTQVDGTLNPPLTLTGGTLSGTGTVNGNVANNGGAFSAGSAASPFGTLAVKGAFSETTGVFDVGFSSAQNNLLAVSGAVTTGGVLSVNYLGSGPFTGGNAPFTFLDYGSLTSSITGTGPTQFFSNETFDQSGNGLIAGQNGFLYALINNTSIDGLQLEVLRNGAPTPAVPEASTTISLGLLLTLGGLVVIVKRRRAAAE